jgi:hypothetical protein
MACNHHNHKATKDEKKMMEFHNASSFAVLFVCSEKDLPPKRLKFIRGNISRSIAAMGQSLFHQRHFAGQDDIAGLQAIEIQASGLGAGVPCCCVCSGTHGPSTRSTTFSLRANYTPSV